MVLSEHFQEAALGCSCPVFPLPSSQPAAGLPDAEPSLSAVARGQLGCAGLATNQQPPPKNAFSRAQGRPARAGTQMMLGAQGPCPPSTTKADLTAGGNAERTLGLISAHRQTEGPVERRQAPRVHVSYLQSQASC